MVDHDDHDDKYDIPTQCIHFSAIVILQCALMGWFSAGIDGLTTGKMLNPVLTITMPDFLRTIAWGSWCSDTQQDLFAIGICWFSFVCVRISATVEITGMGYGIEWSAFATGALLPALGKNDALERMAWKKKWYLPVSWDIRREMAQQLAEAGCNLNPTSVDFCSMAISMFFCSRWTLQIAHDVGLTTPVAQAAGLGGQKDMWRPRIRGSWPRQGPRKTSEGETETWPYKSSLIKHISGVRLSMPTHKPTAIWSKHFSLDATLKTWFFISFEAAGSHFQTPEKTLVNQMFERPFLWDSLCPLNILHSACCKTIMLSNFQFAPDWQVFAQHRSPGKKTSWKWTTLPTWNWHWPIDSLSKIFGQHLRASAATPTWRQWAFTILPSLRQG